MFFEIFLGYKDETILSWLSFFLREMNKLLLKVIIISQEL